MAQIKANTPNYIKIVNNTGKRFGFIPYGENYTAYLEDGIILEFRVDNSEQILYYKKQATENFSVTQINSLDYDLSDNLIVIDFPANTGNIIDIENISDKDISIVGYKQNLEQVIKANDKLVITAKNIGEALYYILNAVVDKIEISITLHDMLPITTTLSHVLANAANPSAIKGITGIADLGFTMETGYATLASSDFNVSGATASFNAATSVLTLSNATSPVSITATARTITYPITSNLIDVTADPTVPNSIISGETFTTILTADSGFTLPDTIEVTGAFYTYSKDTGALTLKANGTNAQISLTVVGEDTAI